VETEALYTACLEVSEDSRITLLVSNQSHTRLVLHGSLPGHMNGRTNGSTRRTNMYLLNSRFEFGLRRLKIRNRRIATFFPASWTKRRERRAVEAVIWGMPAFNYAEAVVIMLLPVLGFDHVAQNS
jgi:hypothetical protein